MAGEGPVDEPRGALLVSLAAATSSPPTSGQLPACYPSG
jgi:hypothetical protein